MSNPLKLNFITLGGEGTRSVGLELQWSSIPAMGNSCRKGKSSGMRCGRITQKMPKIILEVCKNKSEKSVCHCNVIGLINLERIVLC